MGCEKATKYLCCDSRVLGHEAVLRVEMSLKMLR